MKNAGIHLPAGAGLQSVRARVIQNAVVTSVPVFQTANDIVFGCSRLESKKRVGKVVLNDVVLGRKIIGFRLSFLPDLFSKLLALMHVMRNGSEVIEKLAEDIPSPLTRHHIGTEQVVPCDFHRILQQELLAVTGMYVTQAFVVTSQRSVRRLNCRREPSFIDAATLAAEGINVVRMKFQTPAGNEKITWHPTWFQPKDSGATRSALSERGAYDGR